jgi:hypothetical protein
MAACMLDLEQAQIDYEKDKGNKRRNLVEDCLNVNLITSYVCSSP